MLFSVHGSTMAPHMNAAISNSKLTLALRFRGMGHLFIVWPTVLQLLHFDGARGFRRARCGFFAFAALVLGPRAAPFACTLSLPYTPAPVSFTVTRPLFLARFSFVSGALLYFKSARRCICRWQIRFCNGEGTYAKNQF